MVQVGSQKYKKIFKKIYFLINQIWLNLFVVQWYFGSNKKLST
jgi:hypothetical protein